jgi:hypothetical protein
MNLLTFLLLFILMCIGAVSHWIKKKVRKEVQGNIVDYFIADYPGRSASVIGIFIVTAATASATDASAIVDPIMLWHQIVTTYNIPTISMFALGGALQSGWSFDSAINRGGEK